MPLLEAREVWRQTETAVQLREPGLDPSNDPVAAAWVRVRALSKQIRPPKIGACRTAECDSEAARLSALNTPELQLGRGPLHRAESHGERQRLRAWIDRDTVTQRRLRRRPSACAEPPPPQLRKRMELLRSRLMDPRCCARVRPPLRSAPLGAERSASLPTPPLPSPPLPSPPSPSHPLIALILSALVQLLGRCLRHPASARGARVVGKQHQ